jgi:hypothetical protein
MVGRKVILYENVGAKSPLHGRQGRGEWPYNHLPYSPPPPCLLHYSFGSSYFCCWGCYCCYFAASAALAVVTAVAAVVAVAVTMFIAKDVVAVAASASASAVVAVTDTAAAFCHLLAATAAAEGADRLLETEI